MSAYECVSCGSPTTVEANQPSRKHNTSLCKKKLCMCVVLYWGNHVEKSELENFGDAEWKIRSIFFIFNLRTYFFRNKNAKISFEGLFDVRIYTKRPEMT